MDVKDPGKVQNWHMAKLRNVLIPIILEKSLFHDSLFMDVDINNTNKMQLLVSMCFLGGKKNQREDKISLKSNSIQCRTSVFVCIFATTITSHEWLDNVILYKSRNYQNYVRVYMHFISCRN